MAFPSTPGSELLHDLPSLLDHGKLVLSDRYDSGVKCCNIRRLGYGVCKEACRKAFIRETAHLHLRLDRRVAGETGCRHQIHIIKSKRVKRRKCRLDADRSLFRIKSHRQIIQHDVDDIVPDLARVIGIVSQGLVVRDQDIDLIIFSGILKLNAALEGAYVVAKVKAPCGAVPCQNDLFLSLVHQYKILSVCVFRQNICYTIRLRFTRNNSRFTLLTVCCRSS